MALRSGPNCVGVALVPLVMALKSGPNYVGVSERGLALRRERGLAFAVASSGSGVTEVSHRLLFCSRAILVAFGLARYLGFFCMNLPPRPGEFVRGLFSMVV